MGKIIATSLTSNSNDSEFYAQLNKIVNDYQNQGAVTDIKFSTSIMGTQLVYSALVIARESDNYK